MTAVAIIPARGGSRRIPRKNIRDFHGKPMLAYSIEAARAARIFNSILVSTEDPEIHDIAHQRGAIPWWRPSELAQDEVGTQAVMRQTLTVPLFHGIDYACCIYPCAPMLRASDLMRAQQMLIEDRDLSYVVPVAKWLEDPGQFYFGRADAFRNAHPLIGSRTALIQIDEYGAIDINTEDDWQRAERMYADLHGIEVKA